MSTSPTAVAATATRPLDGDGPVVPRRTTSYLTGEPDEEAKQETLTERHDGAPPAVLPTRGRRRDGAEYRIRGMSLPGEMRREPRRDLRRRQSLRLTVS